MSRPEKIRAARLCSGHTQKEAAEAVWITLRQWQRWEAGGSKMPRAIYEYYLIKTEKTE